MVPIKDFYMTILSNDSMEKYANNTQSCFTNYLQSALHLNAQEWVVGLCEIFINPFSTENFINSENEKTSIQSNSYFEYIIEEEVASDENYKNSTCIINDSGEEKPLRTCKQSYESRKTELLFIYCDIIQQRMVGSQYSKVLKIIPTMSYPEQVFRFGVIEYVGVCDNYIPSISIKITNQQGVQIKFGESVLPTLITLHFKHI